MNMFNCNRDSYTFDTLLYHVDHIVFGCWAFPLPGVPRGVYQYILQALASLGACCICEESATSFETCQLTRSEWPGW